MLSLQTLLAFGLWLSLALFPPAVRADAEQAGVSKSVDVDSWIAQGDQLLKERSFNDAIEAYTKAIELDPANPKTYHSRATCYVIQRRHTSALGDLNYVLTLDPNYHPARLQRAKVYGERGSYEDAIDDLQKYTEAYPSDTDAVHMHQKYKDGHHKASEGASLAKSGRHNEAIPLLKEAIDISPGDASSRLHLVRANLNLNDVNSAHVNLIRLVNIYAEPPVYLLLANIQLLYFHEYERSRKTIKVALESDPENKPCKAFFKASKKLQKQIDKVDKMIKSLQLIEAMDLTVDRNNSDSILAMSGKMSEGGVQLFDQEFHVEDVGIEAKAYSMACQCVATLKQKDEKFRACERAAELLPEDPEVLINAAQVAVTRDIPEKALGYLKDAEKNLGGDDDDPVTKKRKKTIRKLKEEADQAKRRVKVKDYYKILGVEKEATDRQIKKAYGKMAMQFHPDKATKKGLSKEEAEAKMIEINEAYEVLKDPEQRGKYDRGELHDDPGASPFYGAQGGGFDPHIMRMFQQFGGGGGGGRRGGGGDFFEFSF